MTRSDPVADIGQAVAASAARIDQVGGAIKPRVGLILGSGLGAVAEDITDRIEIPYSDLEGFPHPGVAGHAGRLVLGTLGGTPVACMQGRAHYYEGHGAGIMRVPVRTLAAIGCGTLVLTNAAGSLRADAGPGSLMMITDHINISGGNPLIGDAAEPRFVNMTQAYDTHLQERLRIVAHRAGIRLSEGVYMWLSGPTFETPAEIRMCRTLGGDAVGMSTVPEVIIARQAGMRVAAVSAITNMGAGLADEVLSHDQTMALATVALADFRKLLLGFLEGYDG